MSQPLYHHEGYVYQTHYKSQIPPPIINSDLINTPWTSISIENIESNEMFNKSQYINNYPTTGPRNLSSTLSILQIFLLLWENVIPVINNEINRLLKFEHPSSNIIINETILLAFLSTWIEMYLHPHIDIYSYWNSITPNKWCKTLFNNRDDFMSIYQCFNKFSDFALDQTENELNLSFPNYWCPHSNVCIDESLIKVKGKCRHRVYDKSKPAKRGFKSYCLVDNKGYLVNFIMHKKGIKWNLYIFMSRFIAILQYYYGIQYITNAVLFVDNYYGSFDLAIFCILIGLKFVFDD